jgi:hypothetical protein
MAPASRRTPPKRYTVLGQTRKWLDSVGAMDDARLSVLGALALDIARTLDETSAARDRAALARELRSTADQIEALRKPAEEVTDGVDDLERARAARRSGSAAS